MWLDQAGVKVIQLSDKSWEGCPEQAKSIGALYRDDVSTSVKAAAFNTERRIYWLRRLEGIKEGDKGAGNTKLADVATEVMDGMFLDLNQTHSAVRSGFEASSGVVKHRH